MSDFRLLALGDTVGRPGREAIEALVPPLVRDRRIDAVVVNAENVAGGSGLTETLAKKLLAVGIDVLTTGDHIWKKQAFAEYLAREPRVLRPFNYAPAAAGRGCTVVQTARGVPIGVVNLLGRVFMDPVDCPFRGADAALREIGSRARIILVDIHAEATSEKTALAHYLDGRVTAVVGTHTHVQTADERILPKGTAYLTDLGMTGPYDSVLGRKVEPVLYRFTTQMYAAFDVAERDARISGAIITADPDTGRAKAIERIQLAVPDAARPSFAAREDEAD